jgi:hypothetical protein
MRRTPVLVGVAEPVLEVLVDVGMPDVVVGVVPLAFGKYWMPVVGQDPGAGASLGTKVPSRTEPRML